MRRAGRQPMKRSLGRKMIEKPEHPQLMLIDTLAYRSTEFDRITKIFQTLQRLQPFP
jgi:hypothetical protein